jgi:hypothetical protein
MNPTLGRAQHGVEPLGRSHRTDDMVADLGVSAPIQACDAAALSAGSAPEMSDSQESAELTGSQRPRLEILAEVEIAIAASSPVRPARESTGSALTERSPSAATTTGKTRRSS